MRKKLQKIVGIMLILFASCFGGLVGCKDKYADMKVELDQTSINLFLGELDTDGEEMNNTVEFTASVSGAPNGASLDVFTHQSTPDVITVIKKGETDENGKTTFTVVANQSFKEPVIVSVRTKEGNKVASLEVLVTKKITGLAVNPQYAPYVVVGEEGTILDVTRGLIFTPEDTSQDRVTFSIENLNGHQARIENGKLIVTKKNGTQPVMVKVTSEASGIEPVIIPVKVIEPIQDEDIKLMVGEEEITGNYVWAVQNLKNTNQLLIRMEISSLEDIRLSNESKIVNGNCFDVEFDTEHTLTNLSTITLYTNENLGTGTLKMVFVINGFDYEVEKNIIIQVAKLPSQIFVNDQDVVGEQVLMDIFDSYQNQLGLPLKIEIGDSMAYEKRFVLSLKEEDKNQIVLKLADGTIILKDENSIVLPTKTTIYVSAIQDFVLDSTPAIIVKTNVEEDKSVSTQINFSLKTSATNVEITAYGNNENNLYVEKDKEIILLYDTDTQNAYLKGLTVEGYDSSLIDVDINDSGENAQKPIITITGKKINNNISSTTLKIKLPNGFESNIVNVHVYIGGENLVLTAPSMMDAQYGKYIVDIETDDYGNLVQLTIARQGYAKLNLSMMSQDNQVASFIEKTFELLTTQDSNFVTVNGDGLVYARNVKQDDDGLINVKATIKYYVQKLNQETGESNGDVSLQEQEIVFAISVYTQITSINLDKQFITLYYTNNLWFDNFGNKMSDVNKQMVNLQIYPSNASISQNDISWKIGELVNSSIATNITNNNRTIELTGNVGINGNIALTVTVVQKNKIYSKTSYITMKNIIAPNQLKDSIDVESIEIKYDNTNSEKLYLGDESSQTISISGSGYKTHGLYIDSRNLSNNSTMHIDALLSNESITNKTICYEVLQGTNLIRVDNLGNVRFVEGSNGLNAKNGGVAYLNIFAQGSRLGEFSNPTVYKCIKIVLANGKDIETAYQIDSENDFWAMIQDSDIQNHYYVITRDIYLANDFGYTNAFAPKYLDGKDKNDENIVYSINNLKINRTNHYELEINDDLILSGDFVALFGVLNGSISNLNINLSLRLNQNINNDLLVAGFVATNLGSISNVQINAQQFDVLVNNANKNIIVGGIVAENGIIDIGNSNSIENCVFNGNINVSASNQVEFINNKTIFVGGMVGKNIAAVSSNNINFTRVVGEYYIRNNSDINCTAKVELSDNISALNNSAIGGVVGYNIGTIRAVYAQDIVVVANNISNVGGLVGYSENGYIQNNYVNAFIGAKDNVGGLVGFANDSIVSNNVVELYENNYIEEKLETNLNVISGFNNVGGLVGLAQNSSISNCYAKSYLSSLFVFGQSNVGGLIGYLQKEEADEYVDLQASFAYMFTKADGGNNVGGFVGQSKNANIQNVYSRGEINASGVENVATLVGLIDGGILQNAYSTILGTTHNDVASSNASVSNVFVEDKTTINSIIEIIGQNCWTISHSQFNDGYAVLYVGENNVVDYILEKLVPTEIMVDIKNNSNVVSFNNESENKLVLKAFDGEIDIASLFTLTSQNVDIPENDLKIYFDNSNVLKIKNNKLSFVNFGTTTIHFVSKYSNDVSNSCEITVVSNVESFDVSLSEKASSDNEFNIKVNTNNVLYSLISGNDNFINTQNLYVKVAVDVKNLFARAITFDTNQTYFTKNYVQDQNVTSENFAKGKYFVKLQNYIEIDIAAINEENYNQYYVLNGTDYEQADSYDAEGTYYVFVESYEIAMIFETGVIYFYENYEKVDLPIESELENYYVCTFDFDLFHISNVKLERYENGTYYEYFKYDTLSIQTLKKMQGEISFALYEKVNGDYILLLGKNINQELKVDKSLTIFEGILSITTDKQSLNMTTLNEVFFVLCVETDIENVGELELQLANQQYAVLNNPNAEYTNYVVDVIYVFNKTTEETVQGAVVYTHEYLITLKMRDEYLMLNDTYDSGTVSISRRELKEGFETDLEFSFGVDESVKTTINLIVEPQNLLKIDAMHFPNGLETIMLDGKTEFYPNELPNNSITPGEFGLLMIDIYPAFANFDEIEVTYQSNNGGTMTFVQVAKATVKGGIEDVDRFLEIKPSAIILNQKIILSRISKITLENNQIKDESVIEFDGRYYVKTLIPTSTVAGTIYSITIKATTYNLDGTIKHTLLAPIINLETMPRPNVQLDVDEECDIQNENGIDYIVINRGGTLNINATTKNYSSVPKYQFSVEQEEYMMSSINIDGNIISINTVDSYFQERIVLENNANGILLLVPLSVKTGTKITLTASVSRFINGIEVVEEDKLHFLVVDYIITGLKLKGSVNNSKNIIQGIAEELGLELSAKYVELSNYKAYNNLQSYINRLIENKQALNNAYDNSQDESLQNEIDELVRMQNIYEKMYDDIVNKIIVDNEKISQVSDKYNFWLWKDNDNRVSNLQKMQHHDFLDLEIIRDGDKNIVRVTGLSSSEVPVTNLTAEVCYIYNTDGEEKDGYELVGAGEVAFKLNLQNTSDETEQEFMVQCNPNIYVTTSATDDNPIPVYTIGQLFNMGNEDRILMNDLYLTTKDGFFTEKYIEPDVNELVTSGQYNDIMTQTNYYYYDENTRFTSINPKFKSFDGNNYKIYINSFALNQEGEDYGFFSSLSSDQLVKNLEIVFLNQKIENTNDNQIIYQDNYTITADDITSANFGLFVGKNGGVITNCRVSFQNVKTLDTSVQEGTIQETNDNVFTLSLDEKISAVAGGFVGVNNGYITNSNISATNFDNPQKQFVNIEANGTVAGFVGENNYKIGSCYALNVAVNNSSKALKDTKSAGFVGENNNNASITQSFAEFMINDESDKKLLDCNVIANTENLENATISSLGTIGGFVHTNSGNINNSYSNVVIETPSRSAGFVYMNTGTAALIRESHSVSISKNQSDTTAFRYFTGTDDKTMVNNLNNAVIKNCYYKASEIYLEQDVRFKEPAINPEFFNNPMYFYGFNEAAEIWYFEGYRPTLITTTKMISSKRILIDIEYTNGVPTNYKYAYSGYEIGTANNPVVIYDAESFLKIFNPNGVFKLRGIDECENIYNVHVRIVKDIDFESFAGTEKLRYIQNVNFVGSIDGNGFDFKNVRVLGKTKESQSSLGLDENEDNQSSLESFGFFKQIGKENLKTDVSQTIIKNLNINVVELSKTKAQMVGVLAGKIENSTITNISIYGQNITVEGQNMVGGLAGLIKGSTNISNISSNVSVKSAYNAYNSYFVDNYRDNVFINSETQNASNYESGVGYINQYLPNETEHNTISYAGGIAGVIDIGQQTTGQNNELEIEYKIASGLKVYGNVTIKGEIVGGITGYLSRGSELYDSSFELGLENGQNIVGLYSAGGLVGENNGLIKSSFVQVNDNKVFDYDNNFHNTVAYDLFENDETNPRSIGGLVGFMPQGKIINSFSKANVIHHNVKYIGGLVGEIGLTNSNNYKIVEVIGTYTTGNVYTTPNYLYSYGSGQTTNDLESIVYDVTITNDITATPQNYIGGLYGKVNYFKNMGNINGSNAESKTNIFENTVAINDWNTNILGYNSTDVLNQMNDNPVDRKDDTDNHGNIMNGSSISQLIYKTNYGYFCGWLENINASYDLSQITTENLYINNSICTTSTTTQTIQNQVGNNESFNYLKFNMQDYIQGEDGQFYDYENNNVKVLGNLRSFYMNHRRNRINGLDVYLNFNEIDNNIWDLESNVYPVISHNMLPFVKNIVTEKDLIEMGNTSSIIQTYYLKNDIYLTKNWEPIEGFKGVFMSIGGTFTIYNININTTSKANVGFFGSTENAIIRSVNFVFGGHIDENGNYMETWDTTNGNYPFKESGISGSVQTLDKYDFGGINVSRSGGETNLSALVGVANSTTFNNIEVYFTRGIRIEYNTQQVTKINTGLICADGINKINIAKFEDIKLLQTDSELTNEDIDINVYGVYSNLLSCNIGGLFGEVSGFLSISNIENNIQFTLNAGENVNNKKLSTTINNGQEDKHNRLIKIGGGFASINNSSINNIEFKKDIIVNAYIESTNENDSNNLKIQNEIYIAGFAGDIINSSFNGINSLINKNDLPTKPKFVINAYHSNKSNVNISENRIYLGGFAGAINSSFCEYDSTTNSIYCDFNYNSTDYNQNQADGILYFGGIAGFVQGSGLKNIEHQGTHNINQSKIIKAMIGGALGQIESNSNIMNIISAGSLYCEDIIYNNNNTSLCIGGFVGITDGSTTISNCASLTDIFAKDNVSSRLYIGGFVGQLNNSNSIIKDCVTYSNVQTPTASLYYIGGFVGQQSAGKIQYSTSLATLFTQCYQKTYSQNIGGFAGTVAQGYTCENCSYAYNLSGVASNGIGEQIDLIVNEKNNGSYEIKTSARTKISKKTVTVIDMLVAKFGKGSTADLLCRPGSKVSPIGITNGNSNFSFVQNNNYYLKEDINTPRIVDIPENVTIIGSCTQKGLYSAPSIRYVENYVINQIGQNSLVAGIVFKHNNENISGSFAGFVNTNNGVIFNCSVIGDIRVSSNGVSSIASFVINNTGYISNCSSLLTIKANGHSVPKTSGFVDTNSGTIVHSYSNGEFNRYYNSTNSHTISGFVDTNSGTIYGCYSANVCTDFGNAKTYGFYRSNVSTGSLYYYYYDKMAFNAKTNTYGVKTTDFFLTPTKNGSFATTSGGLITVDGNKVLSNIWSYSQEKYNYGYPVLAEQLKLVVPRYLLKETGTGTSGSPYLINHGGRLDWIRTRDVSTTLYFKQVHDIDLSAFNGNFVTIGDGNSAYFVSKYSNAIPLYYNGNNYVINYTRNNINSADTNENYALFSEAKEIVNLGVNATITTNDTGALNVEFGSKNISAIVVELTGIMDNCFANVDIKVQGFSKVSVSVSALAVYGGTITNSFAIGRIELLEQNTEKPNKIDIYGLAGEGCSVDSSCYSAVGILNKIKDEENIIISLGATTKGSSYCMYDESISLLGGVGNCISFADSWLRSSGQEHKLGGTSNNKWVYSQNNYPVQSWVINNHYALSLLGYNSTGSAISPYQATNSTQLNNALNTSNTTQKHIVLTSTSTYILNTNISNAMLYGSFAGNTLLKANVQYSYVYSIDKCILSKLKLSGAEGYSCKNSSVTNSYLYNIESTTRFAHQISNSTLTKGKVSTAIADEITESKIDDYIINAQNVNAIAEQISQSKINNVRISLSYNFNTSLVCYNQGDNYGIVASKLNNCDVENTQLFLNCHSNGVTNMFNITFTRNSTFDANANIGLFFGKVDGGSISGLNLTSQNGVDFDVNITLQNHGGYNFGIFMGYCNNVDISQIVYNSQTIDYNVNIDPYYSGSSMSFDCGIVVGKMENSTVSGITLSQNRALFIRLDISVNYNFNIGALAGNVGDNCRINNSNIYSNIDYFDGTLSENNNNKLYVGGAVGYYKWNNNSISYLRVDNIVDIDYNGTGDVKIGGVFGVIDFDGQSTISGNTRITRTNAKVSAHNRKIYTFNTTTQRARNNCSALTLTRCYGGAYFEYTPDNYYNNDNKLVNNVWDDISGIPNNAFARVGGYAGGLQNLTDVSKLNSLWNSFNKAPFVALRSDWDGYRFIYRVSGLAGGWYKSLNKNGNGDYLGDDVDYLGVGLYSLIEIDNRYLDGAYGNNTTRETLSAGHATSFGRSKSGYSSIGVFGDFKPLFANRFIPIDCTANNGANWY